MEQHQIERYFANKGIKVLFNTLGHDIDLVYSFVTDFKHIVDNTDSKKSQNVKITCYTKMYDMQTRHKMTGFEKLNELDKQFRKDISQYIIENQFSPLLKIDNSELNSSTKVSYKDLLKEKLTKIENPLLYLSGGLDSELVALSMLDAGIKFSPVIFEWTNNQGHIINTEEIFFAYRLCKKHNLVPIVQQVNVEQLWQSQNFKKLAIDLQLVSPQLTTYAYMVNNMAIRYPTATHMFGGEIRFSTNHIQDNGELANIVFLNKVAPGYNGEEYQIVVSTFNVPQLVLYYYGNGTWDVRSVINGTVTVVESGVWFSPGTPPASSYEIQSIGTQLGRVNGSAFWRPTYTTIGTVLDVASVQCDGAPPGDAYSSSYYFDINLRFISNPTPVQASSITLSVASVGF